MGSEGKEAKQRPCHAQLRSLERENDSSTSATILAVMLVV